MNKNSDRGRERRRRLTWAADSKRLAFVSHRGSHWLIGVYAAVGELKIA